MLDGTKNEVKRRHLGRLYEKMMEMSPHLELLGERTQVVEEISMRVIPLEAAVIEVGEKADTDTLLQPT